MFVCAVRDPPPPPLRLPVSSFFFSILLTESLTHLPSIATQTVPVSAEGILRYTHQTAPPSSSGRVLPARRGT